MNQRRKWSAALASCAVAAAFLCAATAQEPRPGQARVQAKGKREPGKKGQVKGQKGKDAQGKRGPKHVFSGSPETGAFDVVLARPTDRSITVSVMARRPLSAFLTYECDGEKRTETVDLKPLEPHSFVLDDLKTNAAYRYRLHTKEPGAPEFSADAERSFQTSRAPGSTFRFVVQADSHLDQGVRPPLYVRTLENMIADRPDFLVDLGDTFMTDKYDEFKNARPQYLAQRHYLGLIGRSAPVFLVLGNHDGEQLDRFDGSADSMSGWSNLLRRKLFPNPVPDAFYTGNVKEVKPLGRLENYYAFQWGDALIVALDPFWPTAKGRRNREGDNWSRTLGEDQFRWLEKTLSESKAKFKFVFIHHLVGGVDESARGGLEAARLFEWGGLGADGTDEFAKRRPGWSMPVHRLLAKHKVAAVFHGHDHFFAKQDLDGVAYVLVPQPGHPGNDRMREPPASYGYKAGLFLPPSGHIRVEISKGEAKIDYVRSYLPEAVDAKRKNGEVAHSFTVGR